MPIDLSTPEPPAYPDPILEEASWDGEPWAELLGDCERDEPRPEDEPETL